MLHCLILLRKKWLDFNILKSNISAFCPKMPRSCSRLLVYLCNALKGLHHENKGGIASYQSISSFQRLLSANNPEIVTKIIPWFESMVYGVSIYEKTEMKNLMHQSL